MFFPSSESSWPLYNKPSHQCRVTRNVGGSVTRLNHGKTAEILPLRPSSKCMKICELIFFMSWGPKQASACWDWELRHGGPVHTTVRQPCLAPLPTWKDMAAFMDWKIKTHRKRRGLGDPRVGDKNPGLSAPSPILSLVLTPCAWGEGHSGMKTWSTSWAPIYYGRALIQELPVHQLL